MKLIEVAPAEAVGDLLAHTQRAGALVLKKGTRLTKDHASVLAAAMPRVLVARLEADDVHEDEAARLIALRLAGAHIKIDRAFTGRVNLYAEQSGVLVIERAAIDRFNGVGEALTLATLPPFARVDQGDMVATVKIIPFAVPSRTLEAALAELGGLPALSIAPFGAAGIALLATGEPAAKSIAVTEARIARLGGRLAGPTERIAHETAAIAERLAAALDKGADMVLVLPASVTIDRDDVVPRAIEIIGGRIVRFGMPVDPGNLLLLGEARGKAIIALPGCAKSPKLNGLDWVLERLLAGLPVTSAGIAAMGVGGLLKEIPSRPQPREARPGGAPPRIAGLLLAAGLSRRMGRNKLTATLAGRPLVQFAAAALAASPVAPRLAVIGHEGDGVAAALAGLGLTLVRAPDYGAGMSASLKAGLKALPGEVDAAIVLLGDMPYVSPRIVSAIAAAFRPSEGKHIVVPTSGGRRGNPVLFGRALFSELLGLEGDQGGRPVIEANRDLVVEVAVEDDAVLHDLDTPEALASARAPAAID